MQAGLVCAAFLGLCGSGTTTLRFICFQINNTQLVVSQLRSSYVSLQKCAQWQSSGQEELCLVGAKAGWSLPGGEWD